MNEEFVSEFILVDSSLSSSLHILNESYPHLFLMLLSLILMTTRAKSKESHVDVSKNLKQMKNMSFKYLMLIVFKCNHKKNLIFIFNTKKFHINVVVFEAMFHYRQVLYNFYLIISYQKELSNLQQNFLNKIKLFGHLSRNTLNFKIYFKSFQLSFSLSLSLFQNFSNKITCCKICFCQKKKINF